MRKISLYITALSIFIVSSCGENFLDSEPLTNLSEGNFYKNPKDAYSALIGVYDGMQRMYTSAYSMPVLAEILSDNAFGGTGNSDGFGFQMVDEFTKERSPADRDLMLENWTAAYRAIYRSNVLISKMDQVEWGSQMNLRNVYEAEARFIRAYAYFDLTRLFGRVPLLTEPSEANIPQSEPAAIYSVIAQDLKFAIENIPPVSYSAQPVNERGRITKWAAEALMARVYLYYTGYYSQPNLVGVVTQSDVLGYLEDVIANSGHGLVDDFAHLWPAASVGDYAGEDNKETVFAIKYTYTSSFDQDELGNTDVDGNHWLVMLGIRGQSFYPYGNGWGAATINPKLWDAFDNDDTRKEASIISINDEGIAFNKSDQREYTGYTNKKYTPMSNPDGSSVAESLGGVDFQVGQFQDYVVIRYADVLLMAAELGSPNAQDYFDDVRMRAYQGSFSSLPVTEANIMEERRLEFVGEGIRYWDLLRQGIDVASNTIAESVQVENGGTPTTKTISAAKIQLTKGLQQIPNSEITLSNNVLIQNEGW